MSVATAVRLTGGGPTAARVIGLAAEIVATVARASRGTWADAPGVAAQSVELPIRIAETGADVAELAALAARFGEGMFRADAVSAALLAHAGVRVARHLVGVNLGTREGDERTTRAASAEWRAEQSVAQAFGAAEQ